MSAPGSRPLIYPYAYQLPYWWAGDNVFVHHDGAFAAGFRIDGLDADMATDDELNAVTEKLEQFLNGLPTNYTLQFLRHVHGVPPALLDAYENCIQSPHPVLREQRKRSARHFRKLGLRAATSYLFVIDPKALTNLGDTWPGGATRAFNFLARKRDPYSLTPEEHSNALVRFEQSVSSLKQDLERARLGKKSVRLERLVDAELATLAFTFLNPAVAAGGARPVLVDGTAPETLDPAQRHLWRELSLREQLVESNLTFNTDTLFLNEPPNPYRVMGLKSLPDQMEVGLVNCAQRIGFEHWLSVSIRARDSFEEYQSIVKKRNRASSAAQGYAKDNEMQERARNLDQVLDAMTTEHQRIFDLSLHVLFGAKDLVELDARTMVVQNEFRNFHLVLTTEQQAQLPAFTGMLPGNGHRAESPRTLVTNNAATLLPVFAIPSGDERPMFLAATQQHTARVLDITNPKAKKWNFQINGTSGVGKSVLTNSLVTAMLSQGSPVIVIDKGGREVGSYYRLVETLGGEFIDVRLDGKNPINPFFSRREYFTIEQEDGSAVEGGTPDENKLEYLSLILGLLMYPDGRALSPVEANVLIRALRATYDSLEESDERPLFTDVIAALKQLELPAGQKKHAVEYAELLEAVLDNPGGKLFNAPARVSPLASLTVFDLEGIAEAPRIAPAIFAMIGARIWSLIRARLRSARKGEKVELASIIYDECWSFLSTPAAANVLVALYRTARKNNAGVIAVTQNVRDFLNAGPAVQSVRNNTQGTFLLGHEKQDIDDVAALMGLNERQRYLFSRLEMVKGQYSEFLYVEADRSTVCRHAPSPFDYWFFTTDPKDRELETKVLAEHRGDRVAALRHLAKHFPNGALSAPAKTTTPSRAA